jgi:hypothetical protein
VQLKQIDILGEKHQVGDQYTKEKSNTKGATKPFPSIGLDSGLNENQAAGDAMSIHRVLQKRLLKTDLSNKKRLDLLVKIVSNELYIKAGYRDAVTATRDSLLLFYCAT